MALQIFHSSCIVYAQYLVRGRIYTEVLNCATETAQYSALHFFNFKQNNEYLFISNVLRFICSILLVLAFYFILLVAHHRYIIDKCSNDSSKALFYIPKHWKMVGVEIYC